MAACRSVAQVASDLGRMAGGGPAAVRTRTAGTPALALRLGGSRRFNGCYTSVRKMERLSFRAVADGVTDYGARASEKEEEAKMLQRADSYFATDSRPIVLFDGVCNFCNAGVDFVLDNDSEGRVRMAALQSEAGKALLLRAGRSAEDISSLVLVEKDRSSIKSEGVLQTAKYLGNALPVVGSLGLLFPLFFRDFLYDNVANNRYSVFGKRNKCRVSDARFDDRFVM